MRVIEPKYLHHSKKKKRRSLRPFATAFAMIIVIGALIGVLNVAADKHVFGRSKTKSNVAISPLQVDQPTLTTPKTFTGNEFKDLYHSVMQTYPNTEAFTTLPEITGNKAADERIRQIAEQRGFQLTRIPVTALVKTGAPRLKDTGDDLLQPLAFEGWQQIEAAAKQDGIPLTLNSAYRSPDWQRGLFMERLLAHGISVQQIADGNADAAVIDTLGMTAVPGYSRHHTGYTVDFWCDDGNVIFGQSSCYKWLKADNYLHAKEFGWIPSYPEGADEQGPEPEPWEYVWVGKTLLYQ